MDQKTDQKTEKKTDQSKSTDVPEIPVNPAVIAQLEHIKQTVPDTSHRLFEFLVENLKFIVACCLVVVVAVAAWEGVSHWRAKQAAKAADRLGVILIEKNDPASRVQALEEFLKDSPSSLKPTVQLELAAAAMVGRQYDKAIAAWTELEGSSSADMKAMAGIGHAKSLLLSGKAKEAQAHLTALKDKAPEAYQGAVLRELAVAAEEAGDLKTAGEAYAQLVAKGDESARPYFEFKSNQLKTKS